MGMYPSASLLYGIDLGITDESDWPWMTVELEEELGGPGEVLDHLLKPFSGVGYDSYGNSYNGYTGLALCTRAVFASAYDAKNVDWSVMEGAIEDHDKLRTAWDVLYPGDDMPPPRWFIVLSLS